MEHTSAAATAATYPTKFSTSQASYPEKPLTEKEKVIALMRNHGGNYLCLPST